MIDLGETSEWALLTGAGFSANWGAPVAKQVWADIFGHAQVQACASLRRRLLQGRDQDNSGGGFDFERVLFEAQQGAFGEEGAEAMNVAVLDVYDRIERIYDYAIHNDSKIHDEPLLAFLGLFWRRTPAVGSYVFTLNQDMLLERLIKAGHHPGAPLRPCVEKEIQQSVVVAMNRGTKNMADPGKKIVVPALLTAPEEGWPAMGAQSYYVKLHGSWDWQYDDSTAAMVLGGGKAKTIEERPLLSFYFDVFRSFVASGGKRLVVAGYGFADKHVNDVLVDGVTNHGLRLHVLDVKDPEALRKQLFDQGEAAIWDGMIAYTNRSLVDLLRNVNNNSTYVVDCDFIVSFDLDRWFKNYFGVDFYEAANRFF